MEVFNGLVKVVDEGEATGELREIYIEFQLKYLSALLHNLIAGSYNV